MQCQDGMRFSEGLERKQLRPGYTKPILEDFSRDEVRRLDGKPVRRRRVIDRLNDQYEERVTEKKTGQVLHECKEPLSKHRGHGSAKKR